MRYGPAPDPATLARDLLVRNVVPGGCSNVIARTRLVTRLGGFDPRLTQLADRDLWIRLAQSGRAATCDEIVVAYLLHGGNMRQQGDLDGIPELEYLLEKHRDARERHHVKAGRAGGYRYFARAQLDAGRRVRAARIFAALALRERSLADRGRALGVAPARPPARRPDGSPEAAAPAPRRGGDRLAPHALARRGRLVARSDREHDRRTLAERRRAAGEPCGGAGAGAAYARAERARGEGSGRCVARGR